MGYWIIILIYFETTKTPQVGSEGCDASLWVVDLGYQDAGIDKNSLLTLFDDDNCRPKLGRQLI